MTDADVAASYSARAAEYTDLLGSVDLLPAADRQRILDWALSAAPRRHEPAGDEPGSITRLLDLGCGPGHWTEYLHRNGLSAHGVDLAPGFVDIARQRFPELVFDVAHAAALEFDDQSEDAVLAWFSLIHTPPHELPEILAEIARVLSPGGSLLIGFFTGETGREFAHAVATAYYWAPSSLERLLEHAGFLIVDVDDQHHEGMRPTASISAVLR